MVARAPQDPAVQRVIGGKAVAGAGIVLLTDGAVKVGMKGRVVAVE